MMGYSLNGRTILITGASTGIGAAMARLLGNRAQTLILTARSRDRLEKLGAELSCPTRVVPVDLSTPEGVDELLAATEDLAIDVLINNAGVGLGGPFDHQDEERILRIIELNLVSLTRLTRRLIPPMRERRHGAILNVGSTVGFQGTPFLAVYSATKAYVNHLSESLAGELRGHGIVVSVLCPGSTRTEFFDTAEMDAEAMLKVSMDPESVAAAGLRAIERGTPEVVPGWLNKLLIRGQRFLPRWVVRRVSMKLFESLDTRRG